MAANASNALLLTEVPLTPPRLIRSVNVMEGNPPPPPVLERRNAHYWGRFGEPQALNLLPHFDEADVVPWTPAARPDPEVATRQSLGKRSRDNDGEEPPSKRRLFYL